MLFVDFGEELGLFLIGRSQIRLSTLAHGGTRAAHSTAPPKGVVEVVRGLLEGGGEKNAGGEDGSASESVSLGEDKMSISRSFVPT